jgi:hypothetical protein
LALSTPSRAPRSSFAEASTRRDSSGSFRPDAMSVAPRPREVGRTGGTT